MSRSFLAAALLAFLMALSAAVRAQDKAKSDEPDPPDAKVLQTVFDAFAPGLPEKWESAWVVVREVRQTGGARDYLVDCMYREPGGDPAGKPITGCDRKTVFEKIYGLNRNLSDQKQRFWTTATLRYMPDGKFELKYGYEPVDGEKAPPPTAKEKKKQ